MDERKNACLLLIISGGMMACILILFLIIVLFMAKNSHSQPYLTCERDMAHTVYEIMGLAQTPITVDATDHRLVYDLCDLPPGDYSVTVRAANMWGDWSVPTAPFLFGRNTKPIVNLEIKLQLQ